MARPLRPEVEHGFWHAWNRGNERRNIVRSNADRTMFLELLAETVRRYGWRLHHWVLMTNHFHLVIEASTQELSRGMHWFESTYASWFNVTHDRSGHLFQGRFKSSLAESEDYLRELGRYVELNPVRAGMVEHPARYRWSSYRAHIGLEPSPVWLDDRLVLQLDPDPARARERYKAFVEEKIGCNESFWDRLIGQIYIGSQEWVERMQREVVDARPRCDELSGIQRLAGKPRMPTVVAAVADAAGIEADSIRNGHGGASRMLVAWFGWYEGAKRLRQIAASLRLRSTGHVSNLIRRCDRELRSDVTLQQIADEAFAVLRPPPVVAPRSEPTEIRRSSLPALRTLRARHRCALTTGKPDFRAAKAVEPLRFALTTAPRTVQRQDFTLHRTAPHRPVHREPKTWPYSSSERCQQTDTKEVVSSRSLPRTEGLALLVPYSSLLHRTGDGPGCPRTEDLALLVLRAMGGPVVSLIVPALTSSLAASSRAIQNGFAIQHM